MTITIIIIIITIILKCQISQIRNFRGTWL